MSTTKEEVLKNIRNALGGSAVVQGSIERSYRRSGTLTSDGRLHLFADRLRDYGCHVTASRSGEIPLAIAERMRERSKSELVVTDAIEDAWLPAGFAFRKDEHLSLQELDECQGVLTGCALAIAETGTIVLRHSPEDGRRALTLVPDYHLCVVFDDQVLETVPEAFSQMSRFGGDPITTISGPSATSDIEMIRVQGVHGPRTLDVILVRG